MRRWLARELRALDTAIRRSAAAAQADRYRKHFTALQHAHFLLCHGLARSPSLRQSYETFADSPALRTLSGLAASADPADPRLAVSFSQLAESHTSRPAAFLSGLVPELVTRVRALGLARALPGAPTQDLAVLDSTFLRLSWRLAGWIPGAGAHPSEVTGLRVQVLYTPALDLPEHVLVTDQRTNDCQGFDQAILDDPGRLAALRQRTLLLDLGYYSHRRLAALVAAEVHFVTRRHAQAHQTVIADLPVQAAAELGTPRIRVQHDQRVTVGSPHNRAGAVLRDLRLVSATVHPLPAAARRGAQPVRYDLLTTRWDLTAAEVVQLYLWRWQIELFFRWLKSHVRLLPWLGYSRNAAALTLWLALVVHLLSVLAAHALGLARRSPALLQRLATALLQLEVAALPPPSDARQLAFPGWGVDPAPT